MNNVAFDPSNLSSARCGDCPIRQRAICSTCDADELGALERIKYYRTYDAGRTIVFGGDEMAFIGSVVAGVVTLSQTLDDGRVQMVGLLMPSDFLGRPGRATAPFTATATTSVTLCCFRRRPFEALMARTPHIAQRMLEKTLDELDSARDWMVILGRKSAREKISSLLMAIANRQARFDTNRFDRAEFDLPLTRESMGDYLGLTIETVSRQLTALRQDGVIELQGNRHVVVPDMDALERESGGDLGYD